MENNSLALTEAEYTYTDEDNFDTDDTVEPPNNYSDSDSFEVNLA